ncbi:ACP S-malonyltransferase [Pseudomonadota bacterium]
MSASEKNILYIFPGQGSQYPGIGSDLCEEYATARAVYDQASQVLGYDIAELSFRDPQQQINLTRFTQPVLLTHSIACLQVFRDLTDDKLQPALVAGHSLGEYSALVAAGVLSFESALKLVQQRGDLMGTHGEGEMSAFPLSVDAVRPIAERHFCAIAGCNLPEQTVIGGRSEDLEKAEQAVLEQFERARATRLKTEGAFHTYYMVEAARNYRAVLEAAEFADSETGVLSNFTGKVHDNDPTAIRAGLFFQLFHPVLWHANMQAAFEQGMDLVFEFGGGIGPADEPAGKRPNLQGMIKRVLRASKHEAEYQAVINSATMAAAADLVNQE